MGHMRFPIPWCALRQRETFGSVRCWEDSLHNPVGEPLLRQSFISGWIITAVKQLGHINTHSECGQCRFTSHTDEGSSLPQMEKDEGKKWEAEKRVPEACTDEAWRSPSLYWRQQRGRSLGLTHQHTPCVYSAVCWVIDWILLAFGLAWICILRL